MSNLTPGHKCYCFDNVLLNKRTEWWFFNAPWLLVALMCCILCNLVWRQCFNETLTRLQATQHPVIDENDVSEVVTRFIQRSLRMALFLCYTLRNIDYHHNKMCSKTEFYFSLHRHPVTKIFPWPILLLKKHLTAFGSCYIYTLTM